MVAPRPEIGEQTNAALAEFGSSAPETAALRQGKVV
jgi:crotonobetainyl-CoA:carnitine CoA-transferase CaiB-like acyl-CoA transferase